MSQIVQAIYENGLLRPLAPLDLIENSVVEIDVRDAPEKIEETLVEKGVRVLREAGITRSISFPNAKRLSDEERKRLGKLFSSETPLGDYIDEDREARG